MVLRWFFLLFSFGGILILIYSILQTQAMTLNTEAETIMEHSYMYVYNILMSLAQGVYAPGDKNTYIKSTPVLLHFQSRQALEACVP